MKDFIKINEADNVAVSLNGANGIPAGCKFALRDICRGEKIIKYGVPIGEAAEDIKEGEAVHTHNIRTLLNPDSDYVYEPEKAQASDGKNTENEGLVFPDSFKGYLRENGDAGIRNEIWIIPTVGCVNSVAEQLEKRVEKMLGGSLEGIHALTHPYGCSQLGGDLENTAKILAALAEHPNAAACLIVALGCENLTLDVFRSQLKDADSNRLRFLVCQEAENELEEGEKLLEELAEYAKSFKRTAVPSSKLRIGLKCGGSDGLSGITANPLLGMLSDAAVKKGACAVLTEVPEMFGAETLLLNRCKDLKTFEKAASMLQSFKDYYTANGQPVYENPSPGNKAGGISTLEDKSCGCVQKGGTGPVNDVLSYGEKIKESGISLLWGPGNDLVSSTALAASGCQIVLFTTGRGTPFACPVPTLKVASNRALAEKKSGWIDFDASALLEEDACEVAQRFMEKVCGVCGGEAVKAEAFREIAIFKSGVTL